MASIDILPLSTSSYIADTGHLALEHHGAYFLLIMTMWRADGWINDDEHILASICKVSVKKWRVLATVIRPLLLSRDGKLSQKRLLKEFEKSRHTSQKNSENGKRGGEAKALKNKNTDLANATISPDTSAEPRQDGSSGGYSNNNTNPSLRSEGSKKESSRGTSLPADWQPTANLIEYGIGEGLTREEVLKAGEDMRLWGVANANRAVGRKANWDATFQGWLRREGDRKKSRQLRGGLFDGGSGTSGGARASTQREGFSAFAARRAREAGGQG